MHIFFMNETSTTEIYTLSLHDARPIASAGAALGTDVMFIVLALLVAPPAAMKPRASFAARMSSVAVSSDGGKLVDRKSTRLNSSHANISYAVLCLKNKTLTRFTPIPAN